MISPNNRTTQLKALAAQFPAASAAQQGADQAARTASLQSSIATAPTSASNIVPQAAQVGQQQAAAGATSRLGAQQAGNTAATQVGQLALENRGTQLRGDAANREMSVNKEYQDFADRINRLDQSAKNTLLDNQLRFKTDQAGRTQLNERQLMDYAVSKAKSDQEFSRYRQDAEQVWAKKLYTMQAAGQRIQSALQQEYSKDKMLQDQALIKKLTEAKAAADKAMARQQADAKNKMAAWSAGGTIVGTGIGAVLGGPVGAAAGATLGNAVGSLGGSLFS